MIGKQSKFKRAIFQTAGAEKLSRYGCWPEDAKEEENMLKPAIQSWKMSKPDSKHSPEESAARVASLEKELDKKGREMLENPWLQEQVMRILDLKCCAVDPMHVSKPHKGNWRSWARDLPEQSRG
jgi:hypothetical protein